MPPRVTRLEVWLDEVHIADFVHSTRSPHRILCRYTDAAHDAWPGNSPLISCSLPLGRKPMDATAFCQGLLPEGDALRIMAQNADVATSDTFGLLRAYGRDVAGALRIIDTDRTAATLGRVDPLTSDELEAAVDAINEEPLGVVDESELSLAGFQDKLLLVQLPDGGWGRPLGGAPSTHILKLDDRKRPGLVVAEAACLRLASQLGLTTISPEIVTIGETVVLVVDRYDRVVGPDGVRRLHQEDLCQALGINSGSNRGKAKYQLDASQPPSFRDAARLLDAHAPAGERRSQLVQLMRTMVFTIAIGNADAHAKNLSFILDGRNIRLAPLYDPVPTVMWPKLRTRPGLLVDSLIDINQITASHLAREAASWSLAEALAKKTISETLAQIGDAVRSGVLKDHPELEATITGRLAYIDSSH